MAASLRKRSQAHLASVGEDYHAHRRFAWSVGWPMIVAGAACILHGLIPAIFTDTASRTVRQLYAVIEHREAPAVPAPSGAPFLVALALFYAALPWLLSAPPLFAAPLSLLALAFLPAFWWSELRTAEPSIA